MADYTPSTDFGAKDALPPGNPAKVIVGGEFDTEFNNIATSIGTKADTAGDAIRIDGKQVNVDLAGLGDATAEDMDTADTYLIEIGGEPKKLTIQNAGYIVDTISTSTRTQVAADSNKVLRFTNSGGCDYTLDSVGAPVGSMLICVAASNSNSEIREGGGQTIDSPFGTGSRVLQEGGMCVLIQTATNFWHISGDVT